MNHVSSPFEIKQLSDGGQIEGLLAGFGNVDSYGDVIQKGAFSRTLAARSRPLPMLLQHDITRPIGVWTQWQESDAGLHVKGEIVLGTQDGREAHALAKAGALTGLSIGYREVKAAKNPQTGNRDVFEIDLFEGSLVTFPANPSTYLDSVKSIGAPSDIEALLRAGGLSGRQAKAAASAAWKAFNTLGDDAAVQAEMREIFDLSAARIAAL